MMERVMVAPEKNWQDLKIEQKTVYSDYLQREVIIDLYLPHEGRVTEEFGLLLINDGQDLATMDFQTILAASKSSSILRPFLCVGIHCGKHRLDEYGTMCSPDFLGRGSKAGLYTRFIIDELLPHITKLTRVSSFKENAFCGFSLGGLSALDIVWNNPEQFTTAGVFSGALWWRRHGYEDERYNIEKDRIMHLQVQKGKHYKGLKFFFECGWLDETADRNKNGIIDSIEDTVDIISNLKATGYTEDQIKYLELPDGSHNVQTWGKAFPDFLTWGWGEK